MSPLISIVTINLNNKVGLSRTIESVVNQRSFEFEFIIIDGGSNDGSEELIQEQSEKFIYWVSEKDSGIYQAMNKGVRQATGEYVLFLNSGDTLHHDKVLHDIFSQPRTADIIYGDIDYVYPNTRKRYTSLHGSRLTMAHFFTDTIAHPAAFIRRALLLECPYDETLKIVADNKFFYQQVVFNNCSVDYVPIVVADFDTRGISSQKENWQKTNEERDKVIRELVPPRLLADLKLYQGIMHSPILPYFQVLNQTSGFHRLVAKVVGIMVRTYSWLRPIK